VADGAEEAGAEIRRHVEELASEPLFSQIQYWGRHRSIVSDEPIATLEDLEWADGVASGTPTRFGNVAAQLKQFIDQAGRLWQEGKLADKGHDDVHLVADNALIRSRRLAERS
jgi:NAD(P)H dehydrogenase (quinone)